MKTGIHFERCNVSSAEEHNSRDSKYIAAINASPHKKYSIFEDQTHLNISVVYPEYLEKTLPDILNEIRDVYKEKVGQSPQEKDRVRNITDKKTGMRRTVTTAGWSPIREGVCPIKPTTQIKDFDPFIVWLRAKGLEVIRIDIHHDEGAIDFFTNERIYNHHAHIIVDWVNHATGKTRKLDKKDTSEMQTNLAKALQMERGVSKTITGIDHLSPDMQRSKASAAQAKTLEAKVEILTKRIKELQEYKTNILGHLKKDSERKLVEKLGELEEDIKKKDDIISNLKKDADENRKYLSSILPGLPPTKKEAEELIYFELRKNDLSPVNHATLITDFFINKQILTRSWSTEDGKGFYWAKPNKEQMVYQWAGIGREPHTIDLYGKWYNSRKEWVEENNEQYYEERRQSREILIAENLYNGLQL